MALEWLSTSDRAWVTRNRDLLEAIWDQFDANGEWPDPTEIKRQLRASHPNRQINAALGEMPGALKWEEFVPRQLGLTIFGIGCCAKAELFLPQYLAVAQFALQRFDLPDLPNRLKRDEVVTELGLDEQAAERLSVFLMRDAPFLGSGSSGVDDWNREIDPRAEEFEGIEDPHSLLTFLAVQRSIAATPALPPAAPNPPVRVEAPQKNPKPEESQALLLIPSGLATIGSFIYSIASSPSILGFGIAGGFLGLTIALFSRRSALYIAIAIAAGLILGAVAGALSSPNENQDSYRYFVASTGDATIIIGRIEPRPKAPMQRETVLGPGDPVSVRCLLSENDEEWAKLVNGSFIPAAFLTVEVGGKNAPSCS
jgi:hypothetical protein